MYWIIRRSAAASFASLFYLVPGVTALMAYVLFGEKLDMLSIIGMAVCAAGVFLVNRGQSTSVPNVGTSLGNER
jgi:drug/metabolite transporter (DMT)-like permease